MMRRAACPSAVASETARPRGGPTVADPPGARSGRPLPQLTALNEPFWTGGAHGELRIRRCLSCDALLHPPLPVCRYCRGDATEVATVVGTGVVAGFTINHHQWLPG